MRVPGSTSSLQRERAEGRDIRMVYSTVDALNIARTHPGRQVVFLGVGFETTAPTIAAAILTAAQTKLENFSVISAHKTVPQALEALMALDDVRIDGFILPGHVSVIIGLNAYQPFFRSTPDSRCGHPASSRQTSCRPSPPWWSRSSPERRASRMPTRGP